MRAAANGIRMNYTFDGPRSAPVVMMSHSLATDFGMWDPTVPPLTPRWRVLRYEIRGHGATEASGAPYTLEQLADDALALLRALRIQRVHWVGLSLGGMIGQMVALKAPGVLLSLSLCDTTSRVPAEAKPLWDARIRTAETVGMEPLVEPTLAGWFTAPFVKRRRDVIDRVTRIIRTTPVAGYTGCCHAIMNLDLTDRLRDIKIPTSVIVGEHDPWTPIAASRVIADQIKGACLAIIPDAAQLSNLEQPEPFNRALGSFLDQVR